MSKIIKFEEHIELERQKKKEAEKRERMEQLLHFLQCSTCRMKCSRCGSQVDVSVENLCPLDVPFHLCQVCKEDYAEYQRSLQGAENKAIVWHNQEWREMWNLWVEYQKAARRFLTSREVQDLFEYQKK